MILDVALEIRLSCTFYPTDGKKGKKNEKDQNNGVFRVLDYALWKGVR